MLLQFASDNIIVETPAKLNLYLHVLRRREDGYHDLETVMAAVGLYDTLTFRKSADAKIHLSVISASGFSPRTAADEIPSGANNLVVKTAELLKRYANSNAGAEICLVKRIPAAAGLGGGSSDAAATLVALNRLWNLGLSREELHQLAASLGSDLNFFLGQSTLCLCQGRGEQITELPNPGRFWCVIVRPHSGLSTAEVFRVNRITPAPFRVQEMISAWQSGVPRELACKLHNSLQTSALQLNHDVAQLGSYLSEESVLGHCMSGSGTACFGICHSRRHAMQVASRLRARNLGQVFAVCTL